MTVFGSGFTVVNGSLGTSEVLNDPFTTLAVRAAVTRLVESAG